MRCILNEQCSAFPFFPVPAARETVYSLFCRCSERSGLPDTYIIRSLTGQILKTTLLSALPGYLGPLSKALPMGHPWGDGEQIVKNHTALPYYLYLDTSKERSLWASILSEVESSHPLAMSLGLPSYPCEAAQRHPRYCPRCVEEDRKNLGYSYFRREHQLPGIALCWRHEEILCHGCTICGPYPIKNRALSMPGRCHCANGTTPLPAFSDLPTNLQALQWIARQSAFMVNSSGTKCENIRADLHALIVRKGFSRRSIINYRKLASAIESKFSREVLDWLGTAVWTESQPSAWVCRLLHGKSFKQKRTPLIYFMLVLGVLFESVEEFEHAIEEQDSGDIIKAHLISEKVREAYTDLFDVPRPEWATNLCHLLQINKYSLIGLSLKLGVAVYKIVTEIRRQSLRVPLSDQTSKILGQVKLYAIRKDLRNGVHKTEIYKRYGCSEWALTLIELDQPGLNAEYHEAIRLRIGAKHRRRLLDYISEHPDATRSDIQGAMSGTFYYFFNSDREWFYAQIPKRKQPRTKKPRQCFVDWALHDKQKALELERVFEELLADDRKPVWATKYGTLKRIRFVDRYEALPDRFPQINEVLKRRVETRSDFKKRRIKWAVVQMVKAKEKLSVNKLRRVAGMSAQIIRDHRQFVIDVARQLNAKAAERSFFAND